MRASKPSATACLIAASLAVDAGNPKRQRWVPILAAKLGPHFLRAYGAPASYVAGSLRRPWLRLLAEAIDSFTIPGISLHYLLRKLFIKEAIVQRLESQGIKQVVILGGGFDTLALELQSLYPSVQFLELDHPATQAVKRAALEGQVGANENLRWIPADFTKNTLEEILLRCAAYRQELSTLFLSEGVLMYLSEEDIDRVFSFIKNHSGAGSPIVFTFMEKGAEGRVNFKKRSLFVDGWMSVRGEPFTWGIDKESFPDFLKVRGFSLSEIGDALVFRRKYLAPRGSGESPAEGECVAVALK